MRTSLNDSTRPATRPTTRPVTVVPVAGARGLAATAWTAAGVGVLGVTTLAIMYATEVGNPGAMVFGPLNDITGVGYNLLLIGLVVGLRDLLPSRLEPWSTRVVIALSAVAALSSALLVVDVLGFVVSTAVTTVALAVQLGWLYALTRTQVRAGRFHGALAGLGLWIPRCQLFGAVVVGLALLLPRGSVPQLVVGAVGVIPGALAWAALPVWLAVLARLLRRTAGLEEIP